MKIDYEDFDDLIGWISGKYGFNRAMLVGELMHELRDSILRGFGFGFRAPEVGGPIWDNLALSTYGGELHLLTFSRAQIQKSETEPDERGMEPEDIRAAVADLKDAKTISPDGTVRALFLIEELKLGEHGRVSCQFATSAYMLDLYDSWCLRIAESEIDDD